MLTNLHQQSTHQTPFLALRHALLVFLIAHLGDHSHTVKAHIFIYAVCSQGNYQSNSQFEINLHSLLTSIVSSSTQTLYNNFALGTNDSSGSSKGAVYGLYQCRGDLKTSDCSTCIASAVSQLGFVCRYTYGATLQLESCLVRYEHEDFLWKPDTSLRYKKCSKSGSDDVEFLRLRDQVLVDLQTAIGFKVSRSGSVEGFGQCVGDLSPPDCSSCLSDAVVQLKSLCGSAEAAEVFLAQCYARYWAAGYYDSSPDYSNDDDVGKTVAIIVGATAGVAIVIVLLSFCRKALR